jgi:hypothetical protein
VVFHAVSEHDTSVAPEEHKPTRRRRQGHSGEDMQAPLQLVETQADAPIVAAPQEDEAPRRSRPRKRRGGPVANEPLMLVETQGGTDGARPDNQP